VRDHDPRPYLREHAAAILKIAAGQSGRQTARYGLLKERWPDTVYRWVARYQAHGLRGLEVKPGRGRKPAFSPSISGRPQRAGGATAHSPSGPGPMGAEPEPLDPETPIGGAPGEPAVEQPAGTVPVAAAGEGALETRSSARPQPGSPLPGEAARHSPAAPADN
jgi:hypothetical protein